MFYPKRNIDYKTKLHKLSNRNIKYFRHGYNQIIHHKTAYNKFIDNKIIYRNTICNRNYRTNSRQQHVYTILFILTILIVSITLNRLELNIVVKQVKAEGIDYDSFREMFIPVQTIKEVRNKISKDLGNLEISDRKTLQTYDAVDNITLSMLLNGYNLNNSRPLGYSNANYLIRNLANNKNFIELKKYYKEILVDIKCFPVSKNAEGELNITFIDTWNNYRSYGGNRRHEGTDLMSGENIRGKYPVISMTDGTVEKMGWLEQGGYRVGIRGTYGAYYYYAHLYSYAPDLKIGDNIKAGEFLGYMGDSGYGTEGTVGRFDVHLHVGIYVDSDFGELSVNPYWILRYLETL